MTLSSIAALQQAPELLPCPFCGAHQSASTEFEPDSVVAHKEGTTTRYHASWMVVCNVNTGGCGASSGQQHATKAEAIAAWNRRAVVKDTEGWMPIESAPKDGTEVLVWREDCGVLMGRYCAANELSSMTDKERDELDEQSLFQEDWWGGDADSGGFRLEGSEVPTHWKPLPPPPKENTQ